jgi:hypothetical protein
MQTRDQYDNDSVRRIFESIARDTIDNNGGTYQHRTGAKINHTDGYYVGVGNIATVDIDAITYPVRVAVVAGILADTWPHTLPARAQYVGTWIDDCGRLFVDYTTHIPGAHNLDVALACARRHNEVAVWDCKNRVSIDVPIITEADARECFADNDDDTSAEVRALVAELHDAIFGEDSTASIVSESGDIVADTWIVERYTWLVERLRVLTDAEYAECAYGDDDE